MRLFTPLESIDPCVVKVGSPQEIVNVLPDGVNGGRYMKSPFVVMWQLQPNDEDNEERLGQLAVASEEIGFTEAITTSRTTTCM